MIIRLLGLFLLLSSSLCWANRELVIATGEYAPWLGKELPSYGFANHIISAAFQKSGYRVSYKFLPWKRNYEDTKKGAYTATATWACSEERQKDFYCSDPVSLETYVFFYRKTDQLDWKTLDDLKGKEIGATISYTYTAEFWDKGEEGYYTIQPAVSDAINIRKLLKKRVDLFPISIVVGNTILNTQFSAGAASLLTYHPNPLMELHGTLLFPKSDPRSKILVKKFNEGLAKLHADGTYDRFYDNLLSGDYDPPP